LDFVAPVLSDGLICKAPAPKILNGRLSMLPTAKLVPSQTMQEWRKSNEKLAAARAAAAPESDRVNAAFVEDQVRKEVEKGGDRRAAERKWRQATRGGTLGGDFQVTLSDETKISVLEILSDPERWHGMRCYDPMEPDHYNDERIGVIYAKDRNLFSHAHQTNYRLDTRIEKVTYKESRLDLTTDQMIRALARHPYIFERGEDIVTELVKRVGIAIVPYTAETLQDELRRLVEMVVWRSDREAKPKDPPLTLCRTILAKSDRVGLRKLDAVITAPTLRLDGSVLDSPGYDAETGLFYAPDCDYPSIEQTPDATAIKAAIETLFHHPVSLYDFANANDKATYLAATLTGSIRQIFPLAPGFMGDAALGRTGKTKLVQVIAMMAAPLDRLTVSPYTADNEETRKGITAGLRSGTPVLFTDNVVGTMRSSAWEAVLTAPGGVWSDRILGESRKGAYKTNALMLFTGNNCVLADNLCERILAIKIVTQSETPHLRQFTFDPVDMASQTRPQMIVAALTLLRAFIAAGKLRQTANKLGSFEQWDSLVRQCVMWLGIGDPIENIARMRAHDPDSDRLLQFLTAIWRLKGNEPWTVADIGTVAEFRDDLREVIDGISANARNRSNVLGYWLREKRDAWKGGMRIVEAGLDRRKARLWRIEGRPEEDLERENFDLEAETCRQAIKCEPVEADFFDKKTE
jgi:hypothetical protein